MKMKLTMTAIASIAAFSASSAYAQDITAQTVYYNHNSAQTSEIQNQLDTIVNSCNIQRVQVTCHTDTTGAASYNQALSERRAVDLMNDLIGRGVPAGSISTSGEGETNNAVNRGDNVREELNRRCELVTTCEAAYVAPQQEVIYEAPAETYTENVTEWVDSTPTPIEPEVVYQPAPAPEVVYQPAPAAPAPVAPVATPPALPPVSTSGFGLSAPVIVAGLGALGAAAFIILDDDDNDDDDNSPG